MILRDFQVCFREFQESLRSVSRVFVGFLGGFRNASGYACRFDDLYLSKFLGILK